MTAKATARFGRSGAVPSAGALRLRDAAQVRRRGRDSRPKRVFDVVLSGVGIVLSSPLGLVLSVLIKLHDGGRIFYGQERVGKGGRMFRSWKFRSMRPPSDVNGPFFQADLEEERITPVGRLIRACALDELPQLWNILRGDMSLVGPRALLPEEVTSENGGRPIRMADLPGYAERHSVRPGLTGLAQTRARRDISHRNKFRYDLLYVRHRTLWLDVKLIALSVWISLRGAWPSVGRKEEKA